MGRMLSKYIFLTECGSQILFFFKWTWPNKPVRESIIPYIISSQLQSISHIFFPHTSQKSSKLIMCVTLIDGDCGIRSVL